MAEKDKFTTLRLIENLEVSKSKGVNLYNKSIEDLKNASSVDDVMRIKQKLLFRLISALPLYTDTCYFCIYHRIHCEKCEYAKIHGKCGSSLYSQKSKKKFASWDLISTYRWNLQYLIDSCYMFDDESFKTYFDPSVVKRIIKNLEESKNDYIDTFDLLIDNITKSDTVEEIMKFKQHALISLIYNIPIYSTTCYFCLYQHSYICDGCEYGERHGICGHDGKQERNKKRISSWGKIKRSRKRLIDLISDTYVFEGEKYEIF